MIRSIDALDLSEAKIEEVTRGRCEADVNLGILFTKSDGSKCNSCRLCDGTMLGSLFNPEVENVCVVCDSPEDECNRVSYITDFDDAWKMAFFELITSKEDIAHDPQKIIIKGISTTNKEVVLFDSDDVTDLIVDRRGTKISSLINNSNSYKKYITTFVRKSTTKYVYFGHYTIAQAYTRECGANVLKELGMKILPQYTYSPTSTPTLKPTNKVAFLGCYRDSSDRDLPVYQGNPKTNTECKNLCKSDGYKYMGRQFSNECWCGNSYGKYGTLSSCGDGCQQESGFYGGHANCVWSI